MTNDQIFDRIYAIAMQALVDAPQDKTVSMEAFRALDEIRKLSLLVPTALPGKWENMK